MCLESRIITTPDIDPVSPSKKVLLINISHSNLMFLLKLLSEKDLGLDIYLYNDQVPDAEWLIKVQNLALICLIDTETAPENMQFFVNCVKYSTTQELIDIIWQNFQ
jgi:phosphopantetheinyl transferase